MATNLQQPALPQTAADWQSLSARAYELQAQDRAAKDAAAAERMRVAALEAERSRSRTMGEHVQDIGAALVGQGVTGLAQVGYGLGNMATGGFLERGVSALAGRDGAGSQFFQDANQYFEELKSTPLQLRNQQMRETFKDEGAWAGLGYAVSNPTVIADMALANLPQLAPAIGAAARVNAVSKAAQAMPAAARAAQVAAERATATAAAKQLAGKEAIQAAELKAAQVAQSAIVGGVRSEAAAKAATEALMKRAMYGVTAAQTAGSVNVDAINAATKAGATPEEAQLLGLAAGLGAGATSTLISKLTGAADLEASAARAFFAGRQPGIGGGVDAALNVAKQVGTGATREGVEEYGQSYGEQGFTNLAGAKDFTEGAAAAGTMGALVGVPLGGGLGALNARNSFNPAAPKTVFDDVQDTLLANGVKAKLDTYQADLNNARADGSGQTVLPLYAGEAGAQTSSFKTRGGQDVAYAPGTDVAEQQTAELSPDQMGFDLTGGGMNAQRSLFDVPLNQLGPNNYDPFYDSDPSISGTEARQLYSDWAAELAYGDIQNATVPQNQQQLGLGFEPGQMDLFGGGGRVDVPAEQQVESPAQMFPSQRGLFDQPGTVEQITGRERTNAPRPEARPEVTAPVGSIARARQVVAQNAYDAAQAEAAAQQTAQLDAVDVRPLNAPGKSKAPGVPKQEFEDSIRQLDVSQPITWAEAAGSAASPQARKSASWKAFINASSGVDPRGPEGLAAASAFLANNPKTPVTTRNAIRAAAGMELELTPAQVKAKAQADAKAAKEAANQLRRERDAAKRQAKKDAADAAEAARLEAERIDLGARQAAAQAEYDRTEEAVRKLGAKKARTTAKSIQAAYDSDAQMRTEAEAALDALIPDRNAPLDDGEYINKRAEALATAYAGYKARAPQRLKQSEAQTRAGAVQQLQTGTMTGEETAEALDVLGTQAAPTGTVAPSFAANDPGAKQAASKTKQKSKAPVAPAPAPVKVTTKQMMMLEDAADIISTNTGEDIAPVTIANVLVRDGADLSKLTAVTAAKRYASAVSVAEQQLAARLEAPAVKETALPAPVAGDEDAFAQEDFDTVVSITAAIEDSVGKGASAADVADAVAEAADQAIANNDLQGLRNLHAAYGTQAGKKVFADQGRKDAIEAMVVKDAQERIGIADAEGGMSRASALGAASRQFGADTLMFNLPGSNKAVQAAVLFRAVQLANADIADAAAAARGVKGTLVKGSSPAEVAAAWTNNPLLGFTPADIATINGYVDEAVAAIANPDVRFTRTSDEGVGAAGTPIRPEVWQRSVQNASTVAAARGDTLVAVETVADLEALIGPVPSDAKGAYLDNTIYLVRSNITGAGDFASVFAHESAHHGLRSILGPRTGTVVSRVMANQAMRKRVSARMKQDPTLSRAAAAEEVLVDMHVAGERLPAGIMAKLRAAVAQFFDTIIGTRGLVVSDAEVNALLDGIGRYQNGDHSASLGRIAAEGQFDLLDNMMGDSGYVPTNPMFSRAMDSLDAATAAALGQGKINGLGDYVRDAGNAAKDMVATQLDRARTGGYKSFLLDFMPLDQIRNHYAHLFGGDSGPLNNLTRDTRAKEALTNSTLVTSATASYEGESFTTDPKTLADKWGKFIRDSATAHKARAMNELLQVSTLYKVFPNRAGGLDAQEKIDYKQAGFTEADRAVALAAAQRAWAAVGPEGQQLFKEAQVMYRHLWTTRYEAVAQDVVRVRSGSESPNGSPAFRRYEVDAQGNIVTNPATGKPVQTKEFRAIIGDAIEAQMGLMTAGPYSPLSRYGDYMLIVRDADGKVVWMSGHDSTADRANMRADLFRSGGDFENTGYTAQETMAKETSWDMDGIDHTVIEKLKNVVDGAIDADVNPKLHGDLMSMLTDTYLKSLPQAAIMQHAGKRGNIAGATTDAFRAFNEYTMSASRNIANATYASKISEALTGIQQMVDNARVSGDTLVHANTDKMQGIVNSVKRHVESAATAKSSELVDRTLQAGFLSYMVSPSQMFINAMQTAMVAFPRLAGVHGAVKTGRALKSAVSVFAASRGDMMGDKSTLDKSSVEGQVMKNLYENGTFDFTRTNDMAATARGAHHIAEYGTTRGAGTRAWNAAVETGASFITASEKFNRQVTGLAAAKLEIAARPQTASEDIKQFIARVTSAADRAVYDSHYDYSQSNRPTNMQSPLGKLATQFMLYQVNTLSMMGKDVIDAVGKGDPAKKESARNTLAWMLGMQLTFAGAAGTVLAPLAFAAMDAFRDDEDLVDSRTRFMRHTNSLISSGILAGFVDTQRIGADTLIPFLGSGKYAPNDASAKELALFHLSQIVGPWFGIVTGTATGLEKMAGGDLAGAFGTTGFLATPKAVVDFTKAADQMANGIRDNHGITYSTPTAWDTTLGMVGLRSGARREQEDRRGATYEATMHASAVKKDIVDRLAKARTTGDTTAQAEAQEDMRQWNAAHPDLSIKGQDVARAFKGRVQSQRNADAFGVPVFKAPTASIAEAAKL